jgi:Pyruvate/2-oxoacid:ferredoxin oxidoreductase gamma subunit
VTDPARVGSVLGLDEPAKPTHPRQQVEDRFRDPSIRIAGFGGQGVLSTGVALATLGMEYGYNVSWLPSYGPEMRGGTANCSVMIQDGMIGEPEATRPSVLIAMNRPSMEKFEPIVRNGGALVYNSTLIEVEPSRRDIEALAVPITGLADELGNTRVQSMVAVGAFAALTGLFTLEGVDAMLPGMFPAPKLLELNRKAVRAGWDFVKSRRS